MITITNKNIYYSEFPISSATSLDKVEVIYIDDIIKFFSDEVELGESVTFKRLFEIVSYNVSKFNEIFYSSLGRYSLEPYLQEIENNSTEVIESDYLEICWFCDKHDDELNISPSFHGVTIDPSETYAIDFVSLNNLKNYNVRLNKSVNVIDYNKIDEEEIKTYLGDKSFTLFDLYDAIFREISFHGAPQDKVERLEDLREVIDEAKTDLDNDNLESFSTFDELIERLDANDKFLVKYKDLRDRVEESRMSNKKKLTKLKNCLKEKLKIYDIIENSDDNLRQYYKKLTDLEFNMQILYGEEEDIFLHRFWETPKCTCPKIDNIENFRSEKPIFDNKCKIHGKG